MSQDLRYPHISRSRPQLHTHISRDRDLSSPLMAANTDRYGGVGALRAGVSQDLSWMHGVCISLARSLASARSPPLGTTARCHGLDDTLTGTLVLWSRHRRISKLASSAASSAASNSSSSSSPASSSSSSCASKADRQQCAQVYVFWRREVGGRGRGGCVSECAGAGERGCLVRCEPLVSCLRRLRARGVPQVPCVWVCVCVSRARVKERGGEGEGGGGASDCERD